MKDIKFQAWYEKQNRMFDVYGLDMQWVALLVHTPDELGTFDNKDLYDWKSLSQGIQHNFNLQYDYVIKVNREVLKLRQYIGISDRENEEIYTGDIVERGCGTAKQQKEIHVIRFEVNNGYNAYIDPLYMVLKKSKVIGNIYQNPELLKR